VIGSHELVERLVMPGHGHGDEIADLEQQIRDLDMDDPAYLTGQAELMAEGVPPFTFGVEALMGEWTAGIPGRAKT
jgi:hypothetical protein